MKMGIELMTDVVTIKIHGFAAKRRQPAFRDSSLSVATFSASSVKSIKQDWLELAGRAVEDNVYYGPDYARALLDTVERGPNIRFVTVWDHEKLIAFLPVVLRKRHLPGLWPTGAAWQSDYTFSCTPLLDRDQPARAASGLVASRLSWRISARE